MTIPQWAQRHHRSILFALAAFAAAGIFAGMSMPISLFPRMNFPRVFVNIEAGDCPVERMAVEITQPVEEAVRSVPGVRNVRSNTSRGSANVSVNFDWNVDMLSAMLQVESAINQTRGSLPTGINFLVRRMDPTVFPVLGYSLISDTRSLVELRDIALFRIRPVLSTVTGVARVGVLGGAVEEYQIVVNPRKLNSFGLTIDDVVKAVSGSNVIKAVGRIEENYKLYLVLSDTQFGDISQIERTILRSNINGVVYLEDVATVSQGTMPQWTRVNADGHEAVLFQVYQQPGGNTVHITDECRVKLKELKKIIPPDVSVSNWYNQSDLILASERSVRDAFGIGIGLAVLVLLIFLRNLKLTLIAVITVPMSLAATVQILAWLGMSLNIMTLGGMAAAVGLIIDDIIVMIEHIIRRLRGSSGHYAERIHEAAAEFTLPLAGSSASTIIIFAPLAFLNSVTGAFFKALSLTMAMCLAVSFLIAWLAVPLFGRHLLKQKDTEQAEGGHMTTAAHNLYDALMRIILRNPLIIPLVIMPFLTLGYFAYQHTGSGFLPSMDEGGFILDYRTKSGTSLSETDRLLQQVEEILQTTPEVQTYSRRTGLSLGGFITEANEGDFFIRLIPMPRRGLDDVMDEIRDHVVHEVPGIEIEMAKLMEDIIGDLTAVPQPIEIKLFSDNGLLLQRLARKTARKIKDIPGVVDVRDGIVLAGDAIEIHVDRVKAALEGMTPGEVTQTLENSLRGNVATNIQSGPKMVGLRAWIPHEDRFSTEDVRNLRLRSLDGHIFPLKRIANIEPVAGQSQIARDNLKRMIAVTGRISGRDMGSTVHDVIRALDQPGFLPKDVYYTIGGLYEQQQDAFRDLVTVFVAAVLLIFVLLLFLFESFQAAIAMMLTTLLALVAVFIGLWITHTDLTITAMMGMTMIVGIVTEVTIFFYSEYRNLPRGGITPAQRLILAGKNRMRPIAMTTLAAIFALAPLAWGIGEGADMLQPLAIAIISGLVVQMPLALIVLPVFLMVLSRIKDKDNL
ncbi:putative multidrug efflux transporter AcrB [Candidatus Kuenenia stuttgartiensis]|jgi:CzcA family heavy metal efflux pump|uniref:Putative multidrug efflux transporter AcrB n=1 Tax=Kuenenia stuttgartiensis TaxID=174633 RepID=Q1Q629_KUEST|nr:MULTISPECIES: efflux RND transporter permease subunit [Kuenenia]MBE7548284.1 efflux RND transporter permease subunit [Planctomycetia bacterium]MBZ0190473.1 efflux RND transporter permease subunit [Candidatus Kuenenia stuttgartiensis]MCF6150837.1 efflux RND transporter permease subunit [Candidatus Kuenenia stuttgartiensis]MCL4726461.1 efflux RND transporter permease subunit [Candidatus Kuenenia stuttgartiensis]MCZ7621055.1 efflux RND transporter permease subunit [Candidatus Kuenenia sp.]